jgi:hypothetical protein
MNERPQMTDDTSDDKTAGDQSADAAGAQPSVDDAVQALSAHVGSAVEQHARRASEAMKRTSGSGYDLAAMQQDFFDASMQVLTDSLKVVSHLTSVARAAASKR